MPSTGRAEPGGTDLARDRGRLWPLDISLWRRVRVPGCAGSPKFASSADHAAAPLLHLVGDQRAPLAGWSIASTHWTTPRRFARLAITLLASSICNGHFPIWRCSRLPAAASPGGRCRRLSCVSCLPRRRLTEPAPRRVYAGRLGALRTRAAAARARNQRLEALCSLSRPPCRCPVSADFELWGGRDRAGNGAWAWQRVDLMCRARGRPAAAFRPC